MAKFANVHSLYPSLEGKLTEEIGDEITHLLFAQLILKGAHFSPQTSALPYSPSSPPPPPPPPP